MTALPQGLTEEQFVTISAKVRAGTIRFGSDIQVHGSRAAGTAQPDSDLDIAVRVAPEKFEQFLQECFGVPNPGSAKQRTLQHARTAGKIQAGEAGLRFLRKELEAELGFAVDLSVICRNGAFDQGPYIPLVGA